MPDECVAWNGKYRKHHDWVPIAATTVDRTTPEADRAMEARRVEAAAHGTAIMEMRDIRPAILRACRNCRQVWAQEYDPVEAANA